MAIQRHQGISYRQRKWKGAFEWPYFMTSFMQDPQVENKGIYKIKVTSRATLVIRT